jgi:anti-sigma regulatory factor (Ser/Thr protein kinase)
MNNMKSEFQNVKLPVTEASQVAEARRLATNLARSLGFNETEIGKVAIVVSEAARNLVKHAISGELLLKSLNCEGIAGIEILALDKGPGMTNIAECLRDGYSTAGSMGTGLGAIVRLSALFDIHSIPRMGTALFARLWSKLLPKNPTRYNLDIGAICLPKPGEEVSGDTYAVDQRHDRSLILVVDGLGHGLLAAEAGMEAVRIFQNNINLGPAAIIEAAHFALRGTRGAAMAVAEVNRVQSPSVDKEKLSVRFSGIGNIAGVILSPEGSRNMVSHNGIVGHNVNKIQEFTYSLPVGGLLVMHSDGLQSRWSLERYPGLAGRHPSLIAGVLYRDFNRGRDDVTIVVARAPLPGG